MVGFWSPFVLIQLLVYWTELRWVPPIHRRVHLSTRVRNGTTAQSCAVLRLVLGDKCFTGRRPVWAAGRAESGRALNVLRNRTRTVSEKTKTCCPGYSDNELNWFYFQPVLFLASLTPDSLSLNHLLSLICNLVHFAFTTQARPQFSDGPEFRWALTPDETHLGSTKLLCCEYDLSQVPILSEWVLIDESRRSLKNQCRSRQSSHRDIQDKTNSSV